MASVASRVRERQGERGRLPRMPRMGSTIGRLRHGVLMSVLSVASRLPLPLAYAAARRVGRLRHRALRGRLEMSAQAGRALGATPEQIDAWARRACELSASDTMEAHLLARLGAEPIDRLIRLEGVEQLEAGLADGRGAVLYSLHVRGQYAFCAALAKLGFRPAIIGYPPATNVLPRDRRFRRWRFAVLEEQFGCRCLWMSRDNFGVAVKAANVLRENGVVVTLVDLPQPKLGVEVSFLESRRRFTSGPALLAQSTGAPLLDFYVHRDEDWLPQVAEIGSPLRATGSLQQVTRECAARLEQHVRRHPAQWEFLSSYRGADVRNAADWS